MRADEELKLRDHIDTLIESTMENLRHENHLRFTLRELADGMDTDAKLKLLNTITNYAYDRMVSNVTKPEFGFANVSISKTQDYFAHQLKVADWQERRSELQEQWFDMDEELDDLNDEKPSLFDDPDEC